MLQLDSQHPESYKKTQILEGLEKFPRIEIPDKVFEKPVITQPLQNLESLKEGETARLECHVTPTNDPKLKIEWLVNGKPFAQGYNYKNFICIKLTLLDYRLVLSSFCFVIDFILF